MTIEEKMNRAQTKTRNELLLNLVRKSIITVEQAAVEANLSVNEFKKLMAENNKTQLLFCKNSLKPANISDLF